MSLREFPKDLSNWVKIKKRSDITSVLVNGYHCKVFYPDGGFVELGKGAFSAIPSIVKFGEMKVEEKLCDIGSYVQVADGCTILTGGEHANDTVFNLTFKGWPILKKDDSFMKNISSCDLRKGMVEIGHNVVISKNATILSGVKIGNGAVIGAGAVVTKDIPDFAIVAGNPARLIRKRFEDDKIEFLNHLKWWDFHMEDIRRFSGRISLFDASLLQERRLRCCNQIKLTVSYSKSKYGNDINILGIEKDDRFFPIQETNTLVQEYFRQEATDLEYIYYCEDLFELLELNGQKIV